MLNWKVFTNEPERLDPEQSPSCATTITIRRVAEVLLDIVGGIVSRRGDVVMADVVAYTSIK